MSATANTDVANSTASQSLLSVTLTKRKQDNEYCVVWPTATRHQSMSAQPSAGKGDLSVKFHIDRPDINSKT